jgi:hypothetical protein
MRNRFMRSIVTAVGMLAFSPLLAAQTPGKSVAAKAQTAKSTRTLDPRDLSGIWIGTYEESIIPNNILTPWAVEKFNSQKTERQVGNRPIIHDGEKDNTDPLVKGCDPPGVPRVYFHPRPFEIMQIRGRLIFHYEEYNTFREIWTDGREAPNDPDPSWNGYSVGRWEGDTLVVDTVGFNGKTWVDNAGHPISDAMRLTERFHRIDQDHLAIDFTFQDQKGLTQPFTYKRVYTAHPDWEITEYFCTMEDMQNFYRKVMQPAGKGQ